MKQNFKILVNASHNASLDNNLSKFQMNLCKIMSLTSISTE